LDTFGDVLAELDTTLFVGRTAELQLFADWITRPTPTVVNVVGRGGMGKSALLRQFAAIAHRVGRPAHLLDSADPHPPAGFVGRLGAGSPEAAIQQGSAAVR
jgi:hypothetical protein